MSYVNNAKSDPITITFGGDAHPDSVAIIASADPDSEEGRSQWFWAWTNAGDLLLACWPQGDTYFATEGDHSG